MSRMCGMAESKRPAADQLDVERSNKRNRTKIDESFDDLICPINREFPLDPVTAEDGRVYERAAIETWLRKRATSPVTNNHMGRKLLPALCIKNLLSSMVISGALTGHRADEYRNKLSLENTRQEAHSNAAKGDIETADNLSFWYSCGECGLPQDAALSHRYGKMAVDTLDPKISSLINIAEDYLFGRGTKKNVTLAMHYMTRAAQRGSNFARFRVGMMFGGSASPALRDDTLARLYLSSLDLKIVYDDMDETHAELALEWLRKNPADVSSVRVSGCELKAKIVGLLETDDTNPSPPESNTNHSRFYWRPLTVDQVSAIFKATPRADILECLESLVGSGHLNKFEDRYMRSK